MPASAHKKVPSRASLPRKTTRGPLDEDDPLSGSQTPTPADSTKNSTFLPSVIPASNDEQVDIKAQLLSNLDDPHAAFDRSLSFLLDPAIYHPLSQDDIPAAFRKPPPQPLPPNSSMNDIWSALDHVTSQCDYLAAAHLAAVALTSGSVQDTDSASIFALLAMRYSCLELTENLNIAAQEAKALEDLTSDFYYVTLTVEDGVVEENDGRRPVPEHIMPFSLRVQAIRLQNIGFSDPRRGVAALYDLGMECRNHIGSLYTSADDKALWSERLESLGIQVVNALIEIGDLDCALRTLESLKPLDEAANPEWTGRMILLYIKLGMLERARQLIQQSRDGTVQAVILQSLLDMSEGHLQQANNALAKITATAEDEPLLTLAKQNLAVTRLYAGQITEAHAILEELVEQGHSFPSLTINLGTIYELTSDQSRSKKVDLTNRIAKQTGQQRGFTNADFKL